MPIFSSTPARMTEPTVGASVCASGSQVCSGHSGLFTANADGQQRRTRAAGCRARMAAPPRGQRDQVGGAGGGDHGEDADQQQHRAEQRVEHELAGRARAAAAPPQTAMTAYIGSSTTSKKTKNSTRSRARNTPRMPTSMTSSSAARSRRPGRGAGHPPERVAAAEQREQRGEHDQRVGDAVDAEVEAQVEAGHPGRSTSCQGAIHRRPAA